MAKHRQPSPPSPEDSTLMEAARATVSSVVSSEEAQRLARGARRAARHARQRALSAAHDARTQAADIARTAGGQAADIARTAGAHVVPVTRAGVSGVVAFVTGVGYFWVALGRFLRSPRLWLLATIPAVVVLLVLGSIEAGSVFVTGLAADWIASITASWPGIVHTALHVTLEFAMHRLADATIAFLVVPVSMVAGAPFYVLMTRTLDRRLSNGPPPSRTGLVRTSAFALVATVWVTLIATLGWVLLVPLLAIPGVNAAAVAVVIAFNGYLVGLLTLSIPLYHRGVRGIRRHAGYAWRHRAYVTGFGATSMLALAVFSINPLFAPFRWIVTPVIFIGAVLLCHRMERDGVEQGRVIDLPAS